MLPRLTAVAITSMLSSLAAATPWQFQCKSLDDNEPYGIERLNVELTGDQALVRFPDFYVPDADYSRNDDYAPGVESMRKFDQYRLVRRDEGYDWPDTPISAIFMEKALRDGGYRLRTGRMGGFVKMTGHGYSWASYLCWR